MERFFERGGGEVFERFFLREVVERFLREVVERFFERGGGEVFERIFLREVVKRFAQVKN